MIRRFIGTQGDQALGDLASRAWVLAARGDILQEVLQRISERAGHDAIVMQHFHA